MWPTAEGAKAVDAVKSGTKETKITRKSCKKNSFVPGVHEEHPGRNSRQG
jgi:hypothetical protein